MTETTALVHATARIGAGTTLGESCVVGPHAAIELTAPASAAQSPVGLPASSTRRRMRAPLRRTQHLEPASDLSNAINLSAPSALANPKLQLYSGSTLVAENDDWNNSADVSTTGDNVGMVWHVIKA